MISLRHSSKPTEKVLPRTPPTKRPRIRWRYVGSGHTPSLIQIASQTIAKGGTISLPKDYDWTAEYGTDVRIDLRIERVSPHTRVLKKTSSISRFLRWYYLGTENSPEEITINGQTIRKRECFELPEDYDFCQENGTDFRVDLGIKPAERSWRSRYCDSPYMKSTRHRFLPKMIEEACKRDPANKAMISKLEKELRECGSLTAGPAFDLLEDLNWFESGTTNLARLKSARRAVLQEMKDKLRWPLTRLALSIGHWKKSHIEGDSDAMVDKLLAHKETRVKQQHEPLLMAYNDVKRHFFYIKLRTLKEPISLERLPKDETKFEEWKDRIVKRLLAAFIMGAVQLKVTEYKAREILIPPLLKIFFPPYAEKNAKWKLKDTYRNRRYK